MRRTKEQAEQTRTAILAAAELLFLEKGVAHSTLEQIAKAAGVTRGAVYWHFENKAALFYAMREQTARVLDQVHSHMLSPEIANPLDAIEHSLCLLFEILENNPLVRETFQIMSLRCEYVDEFAPVLQEVIRPHADYLLSLKDLYTRAATKGFLRPGLDAEAVAHDTLAFSSGLFKQWLASLPGDDWRTHTQCRIKAHVALRRADR